MSITSLPSSPNQVSIDDLRVKLNEIIQAANDGTIGGGGGNFALLENGDRILIETGGRLLLEGFPLTLENGDVFLLEDLVTTLDLE